MSRLDELVGVLGSGRALILAEVASALHTESGEPASLGFDQLSLELLGAEWDFERIGDLFPSRGGLDRLNRVAWFGSALADIACPTHLEARGAILREGALFNVAVALFDTIVDEQRSRLPIAAAALHPYALAGVLRDGRRLERSADPATNVLIDLFQATLLGARDRLIELVPELDRCVDMLDEMYRSELGQTLDPLDAKVLPTEFIGVLGNMSRSSAVEALFSRLARLIAMWDDWQDLADDLVARRANSFSGSGDRGFVAALALPIWRVLGGRASHRQIARVLGSRTAETIAAASACSADSSAKVVRLLRTLTGQDEPGVNEGRGAA